MKHENADSLAAPPSGGPAPMSDAEVICTWMRLDDGSEWWASSRPPHLGALWVVEARLTDEQWQAYLLRLVPSGDDYVRDRVHATAEQKIKALASVLRPTVEPQQDQRAGRMDRVQGTPKVGGEKQ